MTRFKLPLLLATMLSASWACDARPSLTTGQMESSSTDSIQQVYYYRGHLYPYYYGGHVYYYPYYFGGRFYPYPYGGYRYPYRYHGYYFGHRYYRNGRWHYY